MVWLVVALAAGSVAGMAVLWPTETPATQVDVSGVYGQFDVVKAEVTAAGIQGCQGESDDRRPDGSIPEATECAWITAELLSGPEAGTEVRVDVAPQIYRAGISGGDRVDLARYPPQDGAGLLYGWLDFTRDLPLAVIGGVFALLVIAVARMRGLAALVGLGAAYATIVWYMLPALRTGENAVMVSLTGSVAIMVVILYLAHGFSMKTTTALLGTIAGLVLTAILGVVATNLAHVGGPSSEEDYNLTFLTGVSDLSGIVLCGVVIAGLGVLNDVTITQASAVYELRQHLPNASKATLFASGMRIGRDHLASTVYTIAFAYAGAALPTLLLIDIYQQPLGQVLTSGPIAQEIVRTVVGAIGLIAAVPLTTAIAAVSVTSAGGARSRARRHLAASRAS
jgi:uncharacterized membrane protein